MMTSFIQKPFKFKVMKKFSLLHVMLLFVILIQGFLIQELVARKVIAVDGAGDGFVNNGEGWARGKMRAGDTILVGQPLDSALRLLNDGDTLIIIGHGFNEGEGFTWNGTDYTGFGTGGTNHPVPPGFGNHHNVHVIFVTCWSDRDPDGKDTTDRALTTEIVNALGGAGNGNTSSGFNDLARTTNHVAYTYVTGQTDTATINNFLRNGNGSWENCPPVNRVPPSTPNQRTCLQALLDSVKGGAGRVTVGNITYPAPVNVVPQYPLASDTCCSCGSNNSCGCTATIPEAIPICTGNSYSWNAQASGTSNTLLSVSAVSSDVAWTAGLGPTIKRTTDGGATWIDATGAGISGDAYVVYGVDAMTAFCSSTPGSTFIYKTSDGGTTWSAVYALPGGFINGIEMVSATDGYAVGDPVGGKWTVLKTTDSGLTWARIATEPTQAGAEYGWSGSFRILGSRMWFGTNSSHVYYSSNSGLTWTFTNTPGIVNSYAIQFNTSLLGLAGGEVMNKTTNGGISYTSTGSPGGIINGLTGSGSKWWCVKSDSGIYQSTDQGTTWNIVHYNPSSQFIGIDVSSSGGCINGWAVGGGGKISKLEPGNIIILNLTGIIQGLWNGTSNIGDTLKVFVRNSFSPYSVVDYAQGENDGGGYIPLHYTNGTIQNGTPYYIVVTHRNSIQTWSKSGGEVWTGVSLIYDFTTSATQAYGANEVLKGGRYCIFGADVNQDFLVDLSDIVLIFNDASVFASGYILSDVNGDSFADLSDLTLAHNNSAIFVSVIGP